MKVVFHLKLEKKLSKRTLKRVFEKIFDIACNDAGESLDDECYDEDARILVNDIDISGITVED